MNAHADDAAMRRALLMRLRWAGLAEGVTLVALLLIAVPLKHIGGDARAVAVLGPAHGIAFLAYGWVLVQTLGAGLWTRQEAWRLVIAAVVPLGTWVNDGFLRRRLRTPSEERP